jgi:non-specific serine/threonine protein kinase
VLSIIGGGGMGVVYRAEDIKLGRPVALKFLPEELGSDPHALERFSREARAISSLDHPNICPIFQFGEHEGRPFMVMQFLEGQTLRDRLATGEPPKPLPLEELLDVGIQVSAGLQAAHEKGIIHRDIKPANIFLTSKGAVKILDFGLAKLVEAPTVEDLETARVVRAFSGETAEIVHAAILNKPPTPVRELNSALPAKLVPVIDKSLEKDRERRYQSAAEMRTDLGKLQRGRQFIVAAPDLSRLWKWTAVAMLVIALAVGARSTGGRGIGSSSRTKTPSFWLISSTLLEMP